MKKKPRLKKKVKLYAGRSLEEWRKWGEDFGKKMDKASRRMKKFREGIAENLDDFGEKFSEGVGEKAKSLRRDYEEWWFRVFGVMGPFVRSLLALIWLFGTVLALNIMNVGLQSRLVRIISNFLYDNSPTLFVLFLFFSFSEYVRIKYFKFFWTVSPAVNSVSATFIFWLIASFLDISNVYLMNETVSSISKLLYNNLGQIFLLFLIVGYFVLLVRKLVIHYLVK